MSEIILPSLGVYGFWLFARIFDCRVNSKTSKFPFSTNLKQNITSKQTEKYKIFLLSDFSTDELYKISEPNNEVSTQIKYLDLKLQ